MVSYENSKHNADFSKSFDRDLVTLAKEGECELNISLLSKIGKMLVTPFFVLFMHYTHSEREARTQVIPAHLYHAPGHT